MERGKTKAVEAPPELGWVCPVPYSYRCIVHVACINGLKTLKRRRIFSLKPVLGSGYDVVSGLQSRLVVRTLLDSNVRNGDMA